METNEQLNSEKGVTAQYRTVAELPTLAELEKRHVLNVLALLDGNKTQAAKVLGISLKTVYNKLEQYAQEEAASGNVGNS